MDLTNLDFNNLSDCFLMAILVTGTIWALAEFFASSFTTKATRSELLRMLNESRDKK